MAAKRALAKPPAAASGGAANRIHRGQSVGLKAATTASLIRQVQSGLRYSAIATLVEQSGLSTEEIAQAIQIPPRTLARRKAQGRLAAGESERLLRLALVFEKALELFQCDRLAARRWLTTPAKAFAGATPLALARTELGAREVEDLIGRMEHGVFS